MTWSHTRKCQNTPWHPTGIVTCTGHGSEKPARRVTCCRAAWNSRQSAAGSPPILMLHMPSMISNARTRAVLASMLAIGRSSCLGQIVFTSLCPASRSSAEALRRSCVKDCFVRLLPTAMKPLSFDLAADLTLSAMTWMSTSLVNMMYCTSKTLQLVTMLSGAICLTMSHQSCLRPFTKARPFPPFPPTVGFCPCHSSFLVSLAMLTVRQLASDPHANSDCLNACCARSLTCSSFCSCVALSGNCFGGGLLSDLPLPFGGRGSPTWGRSTSGPLWFAAGNAMPLPRFGRNCCGGG